MRVYQFRHIRGPVIVAPPGATSGSRQKLRSLPPAFQSATSISATPRYSVTLPCAQIIRPGRNTRSGACGKFTLFRPQMRIVSRWGFGYAAPRLMNVGLPFDVLA